MFFYDRHMPHGIEVQTANVLSIAVPTAVDFRPHKLISVSAIVCLLAREQLAPAGADRGKLFSHQHQRDSRKSSLSLSSVKRIRSRPEKRKRKAFCRCKVDVKIMDFSSRSLFGAFPTLRKTFLLDSSHVIAHRWMHEVRLCRDAKAFRTFSDKLSLYTKEVLR